MFTYEIMSEKEALSERFNLLEAGEYDAVIIKSIDTESKSGNPMMDMTVCVYDKSGKEHQIKDYLVFTRTMMWKVIEFCKSANILDVYESGKLCSDVAVNRTVRVKVSIEQGKEIPVEYLRDKPIGSKYPDKNKIDIYLKINENADHKKIDNNKNNFEIIDDDLPF